MKWKERLQQVLLQTIFLLFNVGTVFGLATFYYSEKHKSFVDSKRFNRYCKFIAIGFFVLYPTAVVCILAEFNIEDDEKGITVLIRRSVFLGNWLLCFLILTNYNLSSVESCKLHNKTKALFNDMISTQCQNSDKNIDLRLNFSGKCVFKTCLLAFGFLFVNFSKFEYRLDAYLTLFECVLFVCLFVPSFIMILASNRFYVATTFCLYLIMKINQSLRDVGEGYRGIIEMRKISVVSKNLTKIAASRVSTLAKNYSELHELFVGFNSMYAKNIVFTLGFCVFNVVFEVIFSTILIQ